MKKLFLVILLFQGANLFAQTKAADAYAASYAAEAKGDYAAAISSMAGTGGAGDYPSQLRLGWLHYLAGDQTQSANLYANAIKLKPKSIEARLGYAYPLAALKHWDKLAAVYEEILRISPNNNTALYRLGYLHYTLGNFEKARVSLAALAEIYPFDYSGTILLGWTELKLGKYNEARALFNRTLLIKPGDSSALEGLKLLEK